MASTATRTKPRPQPAKRPAAGSRRPVPPTRRRWLLPVVVAVAVAALVVAVVAVVVGRGRSSTVAVPPEQRFDSYRVAYHVTQDGAPSYDEERVVRRPYDGIDISRSTNGVVTGVLTNDKGFWQYMSGDPGQPTGWKLFEDGVRGAVADYRPIPEIDKAVAAGHARVLGRDTVLGRRCVIVRSGQPIGSPLQPPTAKSHADICLDASGVPLREIWMLNGKLVRRMDATKFEANPVIGDETFHPGPTVDRIPPGIGGMPYVVALDANGRKAIGYTVAPPNGFVARGGDVVVHVNPGGSMQQDIVERFVRGTELLTVTHTGGSPGQLPGERITLPEGATGFLTVDFNDARITVVRDGSIIMKIETGDPAVALAAARSLHHV